MLRHSVGSKLILIRHLEICSDKILLKYGKYLKINKTKKFVRTKRPTKFQNVRTSSTFDRKMSDVRPLFQALLINSIT